MVYVVDARLYMPIVGFHEVVNLKIKSQREATNIYLKSKLRFEQRPWGEGKGFFFFYEKRKGNKDKNIRKSFLLVLTSPSLAIQGCFLILKNILNYQSY